MYSGVTLNVARPDMNNYATLGVMLYKGIGGSKDFAPGMQGAGPTHPPCMHKKIVEVRSGVQGVGRCTDHRARIKGIS